jgi:hypothetical protein
MIDPHRTSLSTSGRSDQRVAPACPRCNGHTRRIDAHRRQCQSCKTVCTLNADAKGKRKPGKPDVVLWEVV